MAVQIYKTLDCDQEGCTESFLQPPTGEVSHEELRKAASEKGWGRRKEWRGPMSDLCPKHYDEWWRRIRGL